MIGEVDVVLFVDDLFGCGMLGVVVDDFQFCIDFGCEECFQEWQQVFFGIYLFELYELGLFWCVYGWCSGEDFVVQVVVDVVLDYVDVGEYVMFFEMVCEMG